MLSQSTLSKNKTEKLQWNEIVRISFDSASSVIPQVIAVGDTVHIMWYGNSGTSFSHSGFGVNHTRSIDGGKTFSQQKNIIPFDSVGQYPHLIGSHNYLYIVYFARVDSPDYWNTAIIRSTDAGVSWGTRQVIKDYTPWCAAAQDSHIYIYGGAVYDNKYFNTLLYSSNYGHTWDTAWISLFKGPNVARFAFTKNAMHLIRSIGVNSNREIYYNFSTDQGKTWTKEIIISSNDSIESQNPRIATSDSTVFVTWNDGKYGGFFSGTILLRISTDEGHTWKDEEIISQKKTAIFSDISAMGSNCAVVWNSDENSYGSFNIRTSIDGGITFSQALNLANENQFPDDPSVFIDNKNIHVSWWNHFDSEVYYRRTSINTLSLHSKPIIKNDFFLRQNFPNPFNPNTNIEYFIPKSAHVTLKVYDILGKEIVTLVDAYQDANNYSILFEAINHSSGLYLYKLIANNYYQVKKMMLVK